MQNKKSVGTTVLVDYKNTSSGSTGEVKASPRVSRYTDPDDVTTATGNGRIRKTIALCGITVVGALFIDNVFSGDGVFPPDMPATSLYKISLHNCLCSASRPVHRQRNQQLMLKLRQRNQSSQGLSFYLIRTLRLWCRQLKIFPKYRLLK